MDLTTIPNCYHELINDIMETAKINEIAIDLSDTELVYEEEGSPIGCAGYFIDEPATLKVATGKPIDKWLQILIHESCHMDQYLEDPYLWEKCNIGYAYFFNWIEGKVEISNERLAECVEDIIRLEKDCEERSVHKIKQYNLPIDIVSYIQKSNAYLFSYLLMKETRKWYSELYSKEKVWKQAPKEFKNAYKKIPASLLREYNKVING